MVSRLQMYDSWSFLKRDASEKAQFPDASLMAFQHVFQVPFTCLPPNFYISEPMMSWGNIEKVSKA